VWGTCLNLSPGYLYVWSCLAEVESIKQAKSRLCVYKRAFLRLLTSYFCTNTHCMVVVVRHNVWGVPVWTSESEVSLCLQLFGGSWDHETSESRLGVYKRAFLRLLTSYFFTNTHAMVVVVRQKVCGIPVWTWLRDISMFEAVWRRLRA
jgi:hypothetical protein